MTTTSQTEPATAGFLLPAERAIAEARSYLGVKWRHRGRSRLAIDCIGLIVKALAAGDVHMRDRRDYGREPWRDGLRRELFEHFGEPVQDMQPGDVVLIKWDEDPEPAHVGLLADYAHGGLSLIHSYSLVSVTEHRIDEIWGARIVEVFRPWPK